eukprot:TRINITY_DN6977_c0_g1_i2.p1 TRINITY_DN6977_c0_g1~~TRINITY_DN6977_c0_g1_i2.p1  ORF type:complete len:237 (+),score=62.55 TRINITY_DN6977_c0_g1_i2:146-856(+)
MTVPQPGQTVLTVATPESEANAIESTITKLRQAVDAQGTVQLEQFDRIAQVFLAPSSYDIVQSGFIAVPKQQHSNAVLAKLAEAAKPSAVVQIREPRAGRSKDELQSALTLAGLVDIVVEEQDGVLEATAKKPDYAVGASMSLKLNFGKPKPESSKETGSAMETDTAAVWTVSADDFDDDDLLANDGDDLLDDEDLAKASTAPESKANLHLMRRQCRILLACMQSIFCRCLEIPFE